MRCLGVQRHRAVQKTPSVLTPITNLEVPRFPLPLTLITHLGGPWDWSWVTDLLEHSRNMQKQSYSVTFYCSERTQVRISQSKGAWNRVQGTFKCESPCRPLPLESRRMLLFPAIMCANVRVHMEFYQWGRLTWALVSRDITEAPLCRHGWLPMWFICVFNFSRG